MNKVLLVAVLLASLGASAAELPRSIPPQAGIADADLPALAKVARSDAQSSANKAVNQPSHGRDSRPGMYDASWRPCSDAFDDERNGTSYAGNPQLGQR
jgi:hypothetical protein